MIISLQKLIKLILSISFLIQLTHSQYRNWSILDQLDTLYLTAQNQCAGTVISSIKADNINKRVKKQLKLSIDPSLSGLNLIENRVYDFEGKLLKAKQILQSASGTTTWELTKSPQKQWTCKTTIGGNSERITIEDVKDNLLLEYEIAKGAISKSLKSGMVFRDTIFDVMTKSHFFLKTECVKSFSKDYPYYEFEISDNRMPKSERWIIDTLGRTVEQDVPPVFIATRNRCQDKNESLEIVDLWELLKVNVQPCFQDVQIEFTSSKLLDSSVAMFYENTGQDKWLLNKSDSSGIFKITSLKLDTVDWLKSSITIQKNDNEIKQLALKNAGNIRDRLLIVKNLTFFVYKNLEKKAVGTFSNAKETLNAGYGDCGEHAVLLAALLRSVNIPANVVLGLVTLPGKEGYFYHAWVVISINNGVIFADAALGNVPATAGYIPLILDPDGRGTAELAKYIGNISIQCK